MSASKITGKNRQDFIKALEKAFDLAGFVIKPDVSALFDELVDTSVKDLTYSVSATGNDLDPGTTDRPLKTLTEAFARVPSTLYHSVQISLGTGTHQGAVIEGLNVSDGGVFRITGSTSVSTVATGATSGTAGAGTSPTTLNKPTAAANWTSSDLVGKWLLITGGAGAGSDPVNQPVLRPIQANTTTSLTVNSVSGMDSTTTFAIVDLVALLDASSGTALKVQNCPGSLEFVGLNFSNAHSLDALMSITNCDYVVLKGCHFSQPAVVQSLNCLRNKFIRLENCQFSNGADATFGLGDVVELNGLYCNAANAIVLSDGKSADISKMVSVDSASTALQVTKFQSAALELDANDGANSAVLLESVTDCVMNGSGLTGSGNTGYGLEVSSSGRYTFTGSTVTGTLGDIWFLGRQVTWATMSSVDYGVVEERAAAAVGNSGQNKSIKYGNYLFDGEINFSSRVLLYGALNLSSNLNVPTLTTGQTLDMEAGTIDGSPGNFGQVRGIIELQTTGNCTVVLPSSGSVAGMMCGIVNRGTGTITVTPPAGATINGGASVSLGPNAAKLFMSLNGHSGHDFWTLT